MRVLGKFIFYRCRGHKLTLNGFEIVLHPACQKDKALFINAGLVPGMYPAVAKRFGGFIRVLVITRGQPCGPCQQFSLGIDADLNTVYRTTDRTDLAVLMRVRRYTHGLGLTKALHQCQAKLAVPLDQRWRRGRSRGEKV